MATEAMEQIVIPYFVENGMDYHVHDDYVATVEFPSAAMARGSVEVLIDDRDSSVGGLFVVSVSGIAKIPKGRMRRALDVCNEFSREAVGNLFVRDDGGVAYCLDWHVGESAGPSDVGRMLSFVEDAAVRSGYAFSAPNDGTERARNEWNEIAEDRYTADVEIRMLLEKARTGGGDEGSRRSKAARKPKIPQMRRAIRASGSEGRATELLERTVIRSFHESGIAYSVLRDDAVMIELPCDAAGMVEVAIADQEGIWGEGLLNATALDIAKFPKSRMRAALDICNALNRLPSGKFTVDREGSVSYRLDWLVADRAEPEDVTLLLWLVTSTIGLRYPVFTAMRGGNVSLSDAMKRAGEEWTARRRSEFSENAE